MKIICIGRNYADHINELKNNRPTEPVIFLKTDTSVILKNQPFFIPDYSNEINYDLQPLNNISDQEATELTGLKGHSLDLMRDRHWSMPFLNPPENKEEEIII